MSHWIRAAFNTPNLPSKSIGRRAYVVLLIATTIATVLCGGSAAHSGPCTVQIVQLERQIRHATLSRESGPTAPQSVGGLLHHQPTPETVLNAERKANADAAAARSTERARQMPMVAPPPVPRHLTKRSTIGSFPPLKLAVRQLIVRQRSCLHSERRKWRPRGRVSASQRSMLIWRCWREKRSKHVLD
jgi:hypothetical protein